MGETREGFLKLAQSVQAYNPGADLALLEAAYTFAQGAHSHQTRASGEPYLSHPLAVAQILSDFRMDLPTIITGLLHDTVEDTSMTLADVDRAFGPKIAFLVDGVTKLTHIEALSEKARQGEGLRKLITAMSSDIRVLFVKLADRLHNMRTLSHISKADKRIRKAWETLEIYVPLAERIGLRVLKDELENLAFQHLQPDAWNSILSRLALLRAEGQDAISPILAELSQLLSAPPLYAKLVGREKTPYSIWKKMQKKNAPFEQLSDIMAFRVIVASVPLCYQALGVLHAHYVIIPGRFKDYISVPKTNGYQSLHTTLIGPLRKRIEVQIRTHEMDEVCEWGMAAHHTYKTGTQRGTREVSWIKSLLDILENDKNPEEFLESTKMEMVEDQVFCFTPKGALIALPKGATCLDFAYAVHSDLGNHCVGVRINGRMMPLRTKLENGDQIEILTSASQGPSLHWEHIATTGKARSAIRRFLRLQQRQQWIRLGESILQKLLKKEGIAWDPQRLEAFWVDQGKPEGSLEELYLAIGEGNIPPHAVLASLKGEPFHGEGPPEEAPAHMPSVDPQPHVVLEDMGSKDLLIPFRADIRLAKCCHPLPFDPIQGAYNPEQGILVHRSECAFLSKKTSDAKVALKWLPQAAEQLYVARLHLSLLDQVGTFASLATLIAKEGFNIRYIRQMIPHEGHCEIFLDVELHNLTQLTALITTLRMTPWVRWVTRRTK